LRASLKLRQHCLSTTNGDLATRLLLRIRDLAVIDDHGVPRGALARGPTELFGECCAGVGEEENRIILDAVRLSPRAHNPRIIEGDHGDDVDAFALECGFVLDVAGEMLGAAAGGEGAGDGEEDDFFIGPFFAGVVVDGNSTGSDVSGLGSVRDVAEDYAFREAIADLESGHFGWIGGLRGC